VPFEDTQYAPNRSQEPIYEYHFDHVLENPEEKEARIAAEAAAEARINLFNDEPTDNVTYLSDRATAEATPGRIVEAQRQPETTAETIPFGLEQIRTAGPNIVRVRLSHVA
jgi:hypothetical protein